MTFGTVATTGPPKPPIEIVGLVPAARVIEPPRTTPLGPIVSS